MQSEENDLLIAAVEAARKTLEVCRNSQNHSVGRVWLHMDNLWASQAVHNQVLLWSLSELAAQSLHMVCALDEAKKREYKDSKWFLWEVWTRLRLEKAKKNKTKTPSSLPKKYKQIAEK